MRRIRTVTECVVMVLDEDPKSGLTEYLVRKLANYKKIRSFKTGNKLLIDFDSLMAYLESKEYNLPMEQIIIDSEG